MSANTYQYPKTGASFIGSTFYYMNELRGYLKNRLKSNLIAGKTYCVKFHVNIANTSPYGMDGFGAYFGDNSVVDAVGIDKIKRMADELKIYPVPAQDQLQLSVSNESLVKEFDKIEVRSFRPLAA